MLQRSCGSHLRKRSAAADQGLLQLGHALLQLGAAASPADAEPGHSEGFGHSGDNGYMRLCTGGRVLGVELGRAGVRGVKCDVAIYLYENGNQY